MSEPNADQDKQVEIWKVKKLIKSLEAARGNGTSMISLIIRKSLSFYDVALC
jgi:peptide chain release factor subunit 1